MRAMDAAVLALAALPRVFYFAPSLQPAVMQHATCDKRRKKFENEVGHDRKHDSRRDCDHEKVKEFTLWPRERRRRRKLTQHEIEMYVIT
ncbi:hypothetical protein EVAR_62952_1, partial [Eumeta japonica]